jgi:ribosomal protein S27E
MSHEVACPKGHRLQVTEAHFNKQVNCPTCGEAFVVPNLGAAAAAAAVEMPDVHADAPSRRAKFSAGNLSELSAKFGRPMLAIGLVLVVFTRGCDVIAERGVRRAEMKPRIAEGQFNDKWERKIADLDKQIQTLGDKKTKDPDDSDKKGKLQEQRNDIQKDWDKERSSFELNTLHGLEIAARDAAAGNRMWGYWRSMAFVAAAIVLAVGLLTVSWTAQGAERNVCLAIMAIITFSIYIVGVAWMPIPSASSSVRQSSKKTEAIKMIRDKSSPAPATFPTFDDDGP